MSGPGRVELIADDNFSRISRPREQINVLKILGSVLASVWYFRGNVHADCCVGTNAILEDLPAFVGEKEPVWRHREMRVPLPPVFRSHGVEFISHFGVPQVHHRCVAVDGYAKYEILHMRVTGRPAGMRNANGFNKECA